MCMFPEAQKKAQAELDAIVGNDRLPMAADRPSLPYLNALMKEVVRWGPVESSMSTSAITLDPPINLFLSSNSPSADSG